eukprot:06262.XXX_233430_233657_1 [CDS] Oithona nana genome sequencing.
MRSNQKREVSSPHKKVLAKNFSMRDRENSFLFFMALEFYHLLMMVKKYCWLVTHHGNDYRCFSFFVQNKLSNIDN